MRKTRKTRKKKKEKEKLEEKEKRKKKKTDPREKRSNLEEQRKMKENRHKRFWGKKEKNGTRKAFMEQKALPQQVVISWAKGETCRTTVIQLPRKAQRYCQSRKEEVEPELLIGLCWILCCSSGMRWLTSLTVVTAGRDAWIQRSLPMRRFWTNSKIVCISWVSERMFACFFSPVTWFSTASVQHRSWDLVFVFFFVFFFCFFVSLFLYDRTIEKFFIENT